MTIAPIASLRTLAACTLISLATAPLGAADILELKDHRAFTRRGEILLVDHQ